MKIRTSFNSLIRMGDGTVDASEVDEKQKRHFARLIRIGDTNKDGKLSRPEFQQATQKQERPALPSIW